MDPAPFVDWAEFRPWFRYQWQQGEHVSTVGPTGAGKTTLVLELLDRRDFVCAIGTKPKDPTLDRLVKQHGWQLCRDWSGSPWLSTGRGPKVQRVRMSDGSQRDRCHAVLWPKFVEAGDQHHQAEVIGAALDDMFREGSWTIFADEVYYLTKILGLGPLLDTIWTQGRSNKVTLVGGTQRPAWVSLFMYNSATHLFFFADNDETNLRRVAGLGGVSSSLVRSIVAALPRHHVLYVNTRTRALATTRVVL